MNVIDRIVETVSPEKAEKRLDARVRLDYKRKILDKGYDQHGASTSKKSLKGWRTQSGDTDEDITKNLPKLRERSRDLWMGVPLATGALKAIRTSVVGCGLKPNAQIRADLLGLTDEEKRAWERRAEDLWSYWAGSNECDVRRIHDFGMLQGLALLSQLMNGDAFAVLPMAEMPGSLFGLRVRLIESDRIVDPKTKPTGRDILGGVEVNEHGSPIAYWIANRHPAGSGIGAPEIKRIPVFGGKSGRKNILQLLDPERVEQRRGVPVLAPVIESLKQLGRYSDAELDAAVVSSFFTVFITSPASKAVENTGEAIPEEQRVDSDDTTTIELGNGSIVGLDPGDEIKTADPSRPNANFDGFVTAICRQVGAALELPYELLVKHFTSSYSASRGALLEAWKMFRARRSWLATSFCQPIYEEFLTEAVARGYLDAPGFFDDPLVRWAYTRTEWNGPSQGQLNPLLEVKAAKVRVEECFSTRARETAELTGGDVEANIAQRAKEEQMRRESGLVSAEDLEDVGFEIPEDDSDDETKGGGKD